MDIKTITLTTLCIIFTLIYAYNIKRKKKSIFIDIFNENTQPAFIINKKTNIITWCNKSFNLHFPEIKLNDSIKKLNPLFFLKHIQIISKKNEWIANNTNLNHETGIALTLSNKVQLKWWIDLPFPTAMLNKNNEIEDENQIFKELINKSQYQNNIEEFKNIIELAKHNQKQEMILYSSEGIYPAKVWISPIEDKHLICIESRIEYIKLKNKAQESQHLQILGQLTSSIMHDFNNLLTCICGFAEVLEEKIPNDDNLKQIKTNIEQAANLSQELLNFIKEQPIENRHVEPHLYIPKIQNMFKKLLGENIKLEINCTTKGRIKLSETQLERILLNMVINSKDAMTSGGVFKILTKEEEIKRYTKTEEGKVLSPGLYFVIDVIDNGPGIPPQIINKVFQPFFTTKTKGTGLGLSSCLKITEHAGGTIKLTTSNKGTMFSIILPLFEPKEKIQSTQKNENPKSTSANIEIKSTKKIILVEDEEPIRNLVKKSLENQYTIYAFADGKNALEAIQTLNFDCLITDAVLPEIGGIKLAHAAKKKNPKAEIFLVSGYDLDTIKSEMPEGTIYIGKPFTLKKLKETIQSKLETKTN